MLSPGTQFGRYMVLSKLGAGGMGEVFLARDLRLDRKVALKVLPRDLAVDSIQLARFVREARAASALNHPNILTVYEIGEEAATHFIATEFVDGLTLREWVRRSQPELAELLDALRQAATALSVAHQAGIMHRDVKPENLMRREDGLVKVLDFGIAKFVSSTNPRDSVTNPESLPVTRSGTTVGTVRYMSPEQVQALDLDPRTDVWSLGVVLYELVSGKSPFGDGSILATAAAILRDDPVPLERLVPDAPELLRRTVARALRKPVAERFQNAAELAKALEGIVRELRQTIHSARRDEPQPSAETRRFDAPDIAGGDDELSTLAASMPPTNLSAVASPLVGRERDLGEVLGLLRQSEVRMLTITGTGGSGKTRLAAEVARQLLHYFADGVFAVELSALRAPAHVAAQIAGVLEVKETPGVALAESLKQALADKRMLLLLDNFEHLLEAGPLVADILRKAPGVKALVTSQSLLHVRGEREYALEPLDVPVFSTLPPLDEVERTPAVALFMERARAARPSFALMPENAMAVCEICRRLDGLPLAIELAAARVRFLTAQDLLGRLDRRLKLLTGGSVERPDRQQTMRGAIAWSYDLLEPDEQGLVRRLAVFAGGCTLEAVEAVCGGEDVEVLDDITSLVDKSLLRHREQLDGQVRFTMLEVVREFMAERLSAAGESDAQRAAHARHYARLGEDFAEAARSTDVDAPLKRLTLEYENLRSALGFLLDRAPMEGARLASALYPYWYFRGQYSEGSEWTRRALGVDEIEPSVRARLLLSAGEMARFLGNHDEAVEHARECAEVSRAIDDRRMLALALNLLGAVALNQTDEASEVRPFFEEGLALARQIEYRRLEGLFLLNLSAVAEMEGENAVGCSLLEQALEIEGRASRTDPALNMKLNLGALHLRLGDLTAARSYFSESLSIAREFGNRVYVAVALNGMAAVALERNEPEVAARLGGAAEALRESVGWKLERLEKRFHDDYVAKLREALDSGTLEREWSNGRAMSLEAAVEEARARE
jgi:predicted ATPase/serine/threonine protein kinase